MFTINRMPDFVMLLALMLVPMLAGQASAYSAELSTNPARTMTVYVTVDWEGWSLEDDNLDEIRAFRQRYPHIPMMQLLNPVYLLRGGVDVESDRQKIQSTFAPSDTYGLHIHAWKSLVEYCQIDYKSTPSFAQQNEACEQGECGYTVSLEYAYSQQALTQLLRCSTDLLQAQGFARPLYFRAGGWQLGKKLIHALDENGFILDSSRTDGRLLTTKWAENSGLVQMVKALHPDSTPLDQPFHLTPRVLEYPNNGSLADYTSAQQLLDIFEHLIANDKSVLVLGFHQETATSFLANLIEAIPLFEHSAQVHGVNLRWASEPLD